MIKWLEVVLALIAYSVFFILLTTQVAPWWLISIYWGVLTFKNFISVLQHR